MRYAILAGLIVIAWVASCAAIADDSTPTPIAQIVGKNGEFTAILAERSPLSAIPDVAKRLSIKPENIGGADYDLAKETFFVHIPPTPAEDGKYGLMVSLNFAGFGYAPTPWREVIDKHHVIWIGAINSGDNGSFATKRAALMLDAAHNVRKLWPVDDTRVYIAMNSLSDEAHAVPLCYADVFQGAVYAIDWKWFHVIPVEGVVNSTWPPDRMPRPDARWLELARTRGRYVLVERDEAAPGNKDAGADVLKYGFKQTGFKYCEILRTPSEKMQHYANYAGDWFEEALAFLDAPRAEITGRPTETAKPAARAATLPAAAVPAAKPADLPKAAAPAEVKPAPAPSAPAGPDPAAGKALLMAKNYVALQKYDLARPKLQKLIETWPDTPAAREAKQILQDIEGK